MCSVFVNIFLLFSFLCFVLAHNTTERELSSTNRSGIGPRTTFKEFHPNPVRTALRGTKHIMRYPSLSNGRLKKTVFDNHKRLMFVAGLEGTGHHAMHAIFRHCKQNSRLCIPQVELTHALMQCKDKVTGLFFAADADNAAENIDKIQGALTLIRDSNEEKLHIIGLSLSSDAGMMSYPNFNQITKPLDHPDIFFMATMAELYNIDFRVILLNRDAGEIIESTMNRGFGGHLEPLILIENAMALHSQVDMLDPEFYYCVDYHQLGKYSNQSEEVKDFGRFVHPKLNDMLPEMLSLLHYHNKTESTSFEHDYFFYQLESRLNRTISMCTHRLL